MRDYSKLTSEELLNLPKEEFIEFMRQQKKEYYKNLKEISPGYDHFSLEEKIRYWAGNLHTHMRWQAESGLDTYAIFDVQWYEAIKKLDPDFDHVMDLAFEKFLSPYGWEKEAYLNRTGQL